MADFAAITDWLARLGIAFYFLWAAWFNIKARDHHISEFARIGISNGRPALYVGLAAQIVGSIMLLVPGFVVWGAAILIAFTCAADALFHRFWTYKDPGEQIIHKFFLFEHVALVGGMLAVIANQLK